VANIDFRSFSSGPQAEATRKQLQWWKLSAKEAADSISGILSYLQQHQAARVTQHVISSRLYGNLALLGLSGINYSKLASVQSGMRDRVTYNIVQTVTDTVTSKMAKNKPKPYFLTSGGDYCVQRKAKKLNKFVEGIFYENKAYDYGPEIFRDGCIFGDGIIHVFARHGRICYERVIPSELFVDEIEGWYGRPRQMHRVMQVDRRVLEAIYPGYKAALENINPAKQDDKGYLPNVADMITVRESWHLPSGPDANDGKHIITVDGANLTPMEDYGHDYFPFARFRWSPRLYGYWSQGLAEQLQNVQVEINKLLWVIQRSMHLAGTFRIWLKNGSKVSKEHLNNDIGSIISSDEKPEYLLAPIVQPEIYTHLETLIKRGYDTGAVSELSVAGEKPMGLNSGKALRTFENIESDRFQVIGQEYNKFFLELAKLSINCAKDISEDKDYGEYAVKVPGKSFLQTIEWADIDLEEDEFTMQCFPISSLPNDPEGRLQTVQEYAQAGYLNPRQARKLLDFPDLEKDEGLANASEEYLSNVLDKIVDDGEYTAPEPYDNLQLAQEMALEYYSFGKNQGLEPERLDMLRQFMQQIDDLKQAAMPPPPPQGAVPGAGASPQAPPVAPKPSDLVPNVPGAVPNVPGAVPNVPGRRSTIVLRTR